MKPNFALSLSFEGITLLRRTRGGWDVAGEVSIEAEDLTQALADLRRSALGKDEQMRSKIVLPNEQIRYLALADDRATEADVRAALDGATPYAVDDLVYDFVSYGGLTRVAAVARETLEEAEAFAVQHAFEPVSFVAEPEEDSFPGEPFFGTTTVAEALIGKRAKVQRDRDPNKMAPPAEPDSHDLLSATDEKAPPESAPEPHAEAAPSEDMAPPQAWAEQPEPDAVIAAPTPEPEPAPEPELSAERVPLGGSDQKVEPEQVGEPDVLAAPGPAAEPEHATEPDVMASPEDASDPEQSAKPEDEPVVEPEAAPEPAAAARDRVAPVVAPARPLAKDRPMPREVVLPLAARPVIARDSLAVPGDASGALARTESPAIHDPEPTPGTEGSRWFGRATRDEFAAASLEPLVRPTATEPDKHTARDGDHGETEPVAPSRAAEPVFTSRLAGLRVERRPPPGDLPRLTATSTEPSRIALDIAPPGSPAPMPDAQPAIADAAKMPPVAESASPLPGAGPLARRDATAAGAVKPKPAGAEPSPAVRAALMAAVAAPGRVDFARPPPGLGASLNPLPTTPSPIAPKFAPPRPAADAGGGFFSSRRKRAAAALPAAVAKAPPKDAKGKRNREVKTVFGGREREAKVVGGKPRFLGLILTAILLVCLAGVAAWATLSQGGFAALFGDDAPATATAAAAQPAPQVAPAAPAVDPEAASLAIGDAPADVTSAPPAEEVRAAAPEVVPPDVLEPPLADTAVTPSEAIAVGPGEVLSPAAADRFYAATGVWLRAPRLPLTPQSEVLTGVPDPLQAAAVARPSVPALPQAGQIAPDVTLAAQPVPPAPDALFARDARGFLLASPEGTLTPDGLLIFAGSPSIVPPTRPNTVAPPTVDAAEAPVDGDAATQEASVAPEEALAALGGVAIDPSNATEPQAPTDLTDPATAGAVALAGLRPPVRPQGLAPETPGADVVPLEPVAFAGPRPSLRPEGLAPAPPDTGAETAEEATEAPPEPEPAVPDVETALAAIVATAPDPLATATPQAVARATRPDARPNNFARVVSQAEARAERAQPASNGGIAPTALAPSGGSAPEQVSSAAAAPTGPVPTSVASAATVENAINLRSINLIGVYGRPNERRALVRLGNGRYVRVGVGDRLDGGQVNAIGDNALNYVKNGRTLTLEIPSG